MHGKMLIMTIRQRYCSFAISRWTTFFRGVAINLAKCSHWLSWDVIHNKRIYETLSAMSCFTRTQTKRTVHMNDAIAGESAFYLLSFQKRSLIQCQNSVYTTRTRDFASASNINPDLAEWARTIQWMDWISLPDKIEPMPMFQVLIILTLGENSR